eukprot:COSAG01_NODE_7509_length_3176_cov_32.916477_5_plen_32_part_01
MPISDPPVVAVGRPTCRGRRRPGAGGAAAGGG